MSKKRKRKDTRSGAYSKYWLFTINNYTEADSPDPDLFDYIILAHEVGEEGTPHIQGYCSFKTRKRRTGASKVFPRAYLKVPNGTHEQNITYCKKDGDFIERGVAPVSRTVHAKNRWGEYYLAAKEHRMDDIPDGILFRNYHCVKRIMQDNPIQPLPLKKRHNYWVVAPSFHGKSTYVRKRWPNLYDKAPNKWWVGYKFEENILLDDFGPKQCYYLGWYMKRWCDEASFPIETKGGGSQIRPKRIIVTSQYTIEQCFYYDELVCEAITNRFDVIELKHWKKRLNFCQVL